MATSSIQIKDIFLDAIENCLPEQWTGYLDEKCGNNEELKQQVWTLLSAHQGSDSFFDQQPQTTPLTISESPGETIGNYKLLQQIGEGGFGVVFMAEQTKPVRRKVALKVIKPGMDTREVVARFEAERQALAVLDHPNIAKVFDAGATESGRPYFVMELVKGVPLTQYADANHLSTRERLQLFSGICRAVHHAHQKGIIHRDLKPSNLLVTLHDGVPVPKIIDFGVSKAINQPLTEKTMFTQFGQVIGTPQYMSPEQAELSGLDIDTRSDVYSLGVILYELLTGQTPFSAKQIREAGLDEMRRVIREQEPLRPSNILQTFDADTATIVASHRSSKPEQLRKLICGEVDWIVLKALEKDRHRRYDTASSLAEDVENHLSQKPVNATPPTLAYQCWKLYQRYNSAFKFALAISALLLLGIAATTSLWIRAEDQREKALAAMAEAEEQRKLALLAIESEQRSHARADSALQFLINMLSQSGRDPKTGRESTVSEVLSQMASSSLPLTADAAVGRQQSPLDPKLVLDIKIEMGKAYLRAGKTDLASKQFEATRKQASTVTGDQSPQHAECLQHLGEIQNDTEQLRSSLKIYTSIGDRRGVLASTTALGRVYLRQNQLSEAESVLKTACKSFEQLKPQVELIDLPHLLLSRVYQTTGSVDEEDAALDAAIGFALESYGDNSDDWRKRGMMLSDNGRNWEAEFALRLAGRLDAPFVTYRLATAYQKNGNLDRAIDSMKRSFDHFTVSGNASRLRLRAVMIGYYNLLKEDYAESARWHAEGVRWALKESEGDDNWAISQLLIVAELAPEAKRIAESLLNEIRLLESIDEKTERLLAETLGFANVAGYQVAPAKPWTLHRFDPHAKQLAQLGLFDSALAFTRASCRKLGGDQQFASQSWQEMRSAQVHYQLQDFDSAVPFMLNAIRVAESETEDSNPKNLVWGKFELAHVYHWSGETDKARSLAKETISRIHALNREGEFVSHWDLDPISIWQMRVIADGKNGARTVLEEANRLNSDGLGELAVRWLHFARGMAHEELDNPLAAIDAYEASVKLSYDWPSYPQYHFDDRLIDLLDEVNQLDRGKSLFTEVLETRRQDLVDRHPLIGLTQIRLADVMIRDGTEIAVATELLEQARQTMSLHQMTPQHIFDRIDRLAKQAKAL